MDSTLHKKLFGSFFLFALFLLSPTANFAQIIGWNANSTGGGFGTSPWTPSTLNTNLQTSGLIRGSSIATSGTPAGNCWGGSGGWSTGQSDANSFYFTFQARAGYKVSLSSISTATRRSNSGPTGCIVYYSVGGAPFASVASWTTSSTSGTTGTANSVSLAGISALQNIGPGVVVKFRIIPQGSTGNYYLTGGTNSLKIDGSVVAAVNPLITPSTTSLASFGDVMVGSSSASTSFTFDAVGMTEDVSIAAPAGFEISTDNSNWYPGTDITPNAGTLNDEQIWVRFSPTAVGNASGDIILSSTGATNKFVSVTGNGIPAVSYIVVDDEPYGPYCNGIANTFDLDFTPAGSFNSTNFYAQLSNPDGTFPTTPTNIVGVSAISPISVTIPADIAPSSLYRVRVYNDDPLTFSNNDNGHNIVVTEAATLTGITQSAVVCDGGTAIINLTGLIPSSTSAISFAINGGNAQNSTGIIADSSGNASFNITLTSSNDGQSLVIGTIERTDIPSCPNTLTTANSVVLTVHPTPTVTAISATSVCGESGSTTITLTGLIPSSTSDLIYAIAGGTAVTLTGITADASGEASFDLPLTAANNGQTLEITSITRTDVLPNCNSTLTGISTSLVINPRPTAVLSGDQSICLGSVSSDLSIALTGTAPWSITYTDGTTTFPVTNITASPYVFTVTIPETKTYTITAVEDANCTAQASDLSGSATVTVVAVSNGGNLTGSATVCSGANNGTLTLENHVGSIIKWQSSTTADFSGTVSDIANTSATLEYTNLLETTYYRAVVSNMPCPEVNSAIATITVTQTPAPTTAAQTFCSLAEATVADLLPNTAGIKWYADADATTPLLPTEALATGNYYATMTVDGCESTRTLTSVTLTTITAPTTTAQTFCSLAEATVADLLPNTAGIKWYADADATTPLLPTEALATGNYYAAITVDGCESTRTLTSVILTTVTAPTTTAQMFCSLAEATVADLLPNTAGIKWYADADATTPLLPTEALATGNYYATMTVDGCESTRVLTSVTLTTITAPTTTAQTFCSLAEATVADLLPNTAGIKWYADADTTTPLLPTEALATGNYYATMTVDGCESTRTVTSVTVNTTAIPSGATSQEFTEGETLAALEVTGTNLEWFSSEEAAEAGTSPLSPTELLVDGATYYAVQTLNECSSNPLAVTVSEVLGTPSFDMENLKAYPNPTTDVLNISYSKTIESVTVFNLLGQKVIDKKANDINIKLDMSSLEAGAYLVKLSSGQISKTIRILKK